LELFIGSPPDAKFINGILDVVRVEIGEMGIREDPIDIKDLFSKCTRMMKTQAENSNLTLESEIPDNFPFLLGDLKTP
jgi:signal transduction histidine kinase